MHRLLRLRAHQHRVFGFAVNLLADDDRLLGWLLRVTQRLHRRPAPAGRIDRKIAGRFRFVKV